MSRDDFVRLAHAAAVGASELVADVRLRLPAVGGVLGAGGAGDLREVDAVTRRRGAAGRRRYGVAASIQRTMRRRSSHEGVGAAGGMKLSTPTAARICEASTRTVASTSQS